MSEKPAPWSHEEFEQKLRDKEALYHINHPFHKLMHSVQILSGVGGWAGIGMAIPSLENSSDGLGAVGAYKALSSWTNLGGVLSVFSL